MWSPFLNKIKLYLKIWSWFIFVCELPVDGGQLLLGASVFLQLWSNHVKLLAYNFFYTNPLTILTVHALNCPPLRARLFFSQIWSQPPNYHWEGGKSRGEVLRQQTSRGLRKTDGGLVLFRLLLEGWMIGNISLISNLSRRKSSSVQMCSVRVSSKI